jgi:hypothetical protein
MTLRTRKKKKKKLTRSVSNFVFCCCVLLPVVRSYPSSYFGPRLPGHYTGFSSVVAGLPEPSGGALFGTGLAVLEGISPANASEVAEAWRLREPEGSRCVGFCFILLFFVFCFF